MQAPETGSEFDGESLSRSGDIDGCVLTRDPGTRGVEQSGIFYCVSLLASVPEAELTLPFTVATMVKLARDLSIYSRDL